MILKFLRALLHGVLVVVGSVSFTTLFFLVLPLMQAITSTLEADTVLGAAVGQELIDNFIAIKREEMRIVSEKSDEGSGVP